MTNTFEVYGQINLTEAEAAIDDLEARLAHLRVGVNYLYRRTCKYADDELRYEFIEMGAMMEKVERAISKLKSLTALAPRYRE